MAGSASRPVIGVQQRVEEALASVANEDVEVVCAGRTDTGVHATGQVVHFDTDSERSNRGWLLGVNTNLPDDIAVTWAQPVAGRFSRAFFGSVTQLSLPDPQSPGSVRRLQRAPRVVGISSRWMQPHARGCASAWWADTIFRRFARPAARRTRPVREISHIAVESRRRQD